MSKFVVVEGKHQISPGTSEIEAVYAYKGEVVELDAKIAAKFPGKFSRFVEQPSAEELAEQEAAEAEAERLRKEEEAKNALAAEKAKAAADSKAPAGKPAGKPAAAP